VAFREVTMHEVREILRRWLRGEGLREIARQGIADRKTVRRYIQAAQASGLESDHLETSLNDEMLAAVLAHLQTEGRQSSNGLTWKQCSEQRDFIRAKLDQGVRLTKVRKLLRRQGIDLPYATLWRYASSELGFGKTSATIPVADCEAGEELQLDTGWVGSIVPDLAGRRRRFRAWIFTAVRSRYRFVYPTFPETTPVAIEACEAAWEFFGGIFKTLIPDNLKAVVQEADPLAPKINVAFLEYSQARGFVIDTARVRRPKDKARVERAVPTVRDDCFAGERLIDINHARQHARHWCLEEYGMRRHSSTLRRPREAFESEEKGVLLPAPSEPYDVPVWCEPKVHRDQHALVEKALYSLPTHFVGRTLHARADRNIVRFYDQGKLVKAYPRVPPGKRQTDAADFPADKAAYAMRDITFLKRKAALHGPAVARFAEALLDSPLPWTRMRQVYALFGLAKRYGSLRLDHACTLALDVELIDVFRLRTILAQAPPGTLINPVTAPKVLPIPRFFRQPAQLPLPFNANTSLDKGDRS
jgi:hypothetical protein